MTSTVIVIQGCSRGFGKALLRASLCHCEITKPGEETIFILLGTLREATANTWNEVYEESIGKPYAPETESRIQVFVEEVDLSRSDEWRRISEVLRLIFGHLHSTIHTCFIFLNSGSVTPVGPLVTGQADKPKSLRVRDSTGFETAIIDHCNLNFSSFTVLLRLLVMLAVGHQQVTRLSKLRILNVSSLAAIDELYGLAIYGATKSARESIVRCLYREMAQDYPGLDTRVLNYAPGPMDTELVRKDLLSHQTPKNFVKSSVKTFVDMNQSAGVCLDLLTTRESHPDRFSGQHVDFFDLIRD